MTRRVVASMAAVACALAVTACRGPRPPVEIGVQEVGSDIVLGRRAGATAAPAPIPPITLVAALPAIAPSFLPGGVTSTTTPAPPLPCPTADPFAGPRLVAGPAVSAPPPAATYAFRNDGRYEVSGPDARQGRFPTSSVREVRDVQSGNGSFVYTVRVDVVGTVTDTVYHVVTAGSPAQAAGLYVQSVTSTAAGQPPARFAPLPEMELLPFPAVPGSTFSVTAVDPNPNTTMTMRYTGTVGQKARVDACGTPLDAVTVDLTAGSVVSASSNETFTAHYAIATQYGGLAIADTVKVSGTEGRDTVSRDNTAVINEVPEEPRS